MSRRGFRGLAAAVAALSVATSAAAAPQTPQQRRAEILAAYGGAYEGPIAAYVSKVGERMAVAAGQGGRCTFSVINTAVVNAFASPPGCDIYVTRGLLALIRSENELAAVLGHEVGHVAADHAGGRQTRSAITGIGALVLGVVTGSSAVAQIAGKAGELNVLSYSRGQEFEADSLSARYLTGAGYNPYGLADMLSALQASDQVEALGEGAQSKTQSSWTRTHPLTGDRIARAVAEAQPSGAPLPSPPGAPDPYLAQVNDLIWGDDPAEGVVLGRRFLHPGLGIGFTAPARFALANSPRAVVFQGPGGLKGLFAGAVGKAGAAPSDEAYAVLRQLVGQAPVSTGEVQRTRINGVEAAVLPAQAQTNSGRVDVTVVAYAVGRESFHFAMIAPAGQAGAFDPLIGSFHRLTAAERAEARPRRIEVVTVRPGETVETLAGRMAVADHAREWFAAINGLAPADTLRPGDRVKVVTLTP